MKRSANEGVHQSGARPYSYRPAGSSPATRPPWGSEATRATDSVRPANLWTQAFLARSTCL